MSENTERWLGGRKPDRPQKDGLNDQQRKALWTIRKEAKAAKSELTSGGKGGLSPSLVLGVMRRDKYTCKLCGKKGSMAENGGIGVHHKGGVENTASKWLRKKGHSNEPNNLVTICNNCHDSLHEKDRAAGREED